MKSTKAGIWRSGRRPTTNHYPLTTIHHIVELSNSPADPALSIARARVAPGGATALHWLRGIWERYVILAGEAEVELDGGPWQPVSTGDAVLIPPGCRQRIRNCGG